MDARELKFMLSLLGQPDYRAPIVQVKPNIRTKAAERDRLCRSLSDRGLVDCSEQVVKFRISPAGRALLKLDVTKLPISETELMLLQVSEMGSVEVSAVTAAIALPLTAAAIHTAVDRLVSRGLVKAEKTRIDEVWITHRGLEFLRDEFNPSGTTLDLSLDHLGEYLRFVRSSLRSPRLAATSTTAKLSTVPRTSASLTASPQTSGTTLPVTTAVSLSAVNLSAVNLSAVNSSAVTPPSAIAGSSNASPNPSPNSLTNPDWQPVQNAAIGTPLTPSETTPLDTSPTILVPSVTPPITPPLPSPSPYPSTIVPMVSAVTSTKIAENSTQTANLPQNPANPVNPVKSVSCFTPSASALQEGLENLSSDRLYQFIVELDRNLRTDNYLPIYHLRDHLHPSCTRQQVDQMLYELQRQDRIELSSLQEATNYTPEQINAGIPQDVGGPLFFIVCIS